MLSLLYCTYIKSVSLQIICLLTKSLEDARKNMVNYYMVTGILTMHCCVMLINESQWSQSRNTTTRCCDFVSALYVFTL